MASPSRFVQTLAAVARFALAALTVALACRVVAVLERAHRLRFSASLSLLASAREDKGRKHGYTPEGQYNEWAASHLQQCAASEWSATFAGLAPHRQEENVTLAYTPRGNSTLLVESDLSAWNNIRMSWETVVCFAYKTRRIYVVPHIPVDGYADIRLKFPIVVGGVRKMRQLNMFDYYDEASFRRVIPSILDSDPLPGPEGETFSPRTNPWAMPIENLGRYPHLVYKGGPGHLATRVFRQFANAETFLPRAEYVSLVQKAFRLRQDLLCMAISRLTDYGLRPRSYVALHRRRGDTIKIQGYNVSAEETARHVEPLLRGRTVLVLTDTHEPDFLQLLRKVSGAEKVVSWAGREWHGEEKTHSVQIDMLAAVGAETFIGTPFSTVSTGIVRWRTQAGTHRVGDPVHYTKKWSPGYTGWPSPGARGTYL